MKKLRTKNSSVLIAASATSGDHYGQDEARATRFESCVTASKEILHKTIRDCVRMPDPRIRHIDDLQDAEIKEKFSEAALGASADEPLDAFVFYYIGHGQLFNNELYLYNSKTEVADPSRDGIPISLIHNEIERVPALVKIVIFDCCNSGAALVGIKHDAFPSTYMEERPELCGSYGIAAAPRGLPAWIPHGSTKTAFTECVCDVLRNGIDNLEFVITLDDFFRSVRQLMSERGYGRVLRVSSVDDESIALAENPACAPDSWDTDAFAALKKKIERNKDELETLGDKVDDVKSKLDNDFRSIAQLGTMIKDAEENLKQFETTTSNDRKFLTEKIRDTFVVSSVISVAAAAFACAAAVFIATR